MFTQNSGFRFHVMFYLLWLRGFWFYFGFFLFLFLQDASLETETGAQLIGEIAEQAEISLPTVPLKIKNLPSEREFYIPSVDLLTAQVKC